MRVGVIAGTTLTSRSSIRTHLRGIDLIIHAGRIGHPQVLEELGEIAPVRAIVGQKDFMQFGDQLPEVLDLNLCGARIVVAHMIGLPPDLLPPIQQLMASSPPDVIIHGHNPNSQTLWMGGTLFVSPGHAAPKQDGGAATCALIEVDGPGRITTHVLDLAAAAAPPPPAGGPGIGGPRPRTV